MANVKNEIFSNSNLDESGDIEPIKLLFFLMLSLYILHEGYQFYDIRRGHTLFRGYLLYIWSLENILDTLLIGSSVLHLVTITYNRFVLRKINTQLTRIYTSDFFSLHCVVNMEHTIQTQSNVMLFIAFLKALNLLKLNPKTYLITDTIRAGFADLTIFICFVMANYVLFGLIGYVLFNVDPQFATIKGSIYTSIISMVRHIDFKLLLEKQFVWLFLWQLIFYFYAQRILINFVIAVIIHYFDRVRLNHRKTETEKVFEKIVKNVLEYFDFSSTSKKQR